MRRKPNLVLSIENGVAFIDVSTKKFPLTVTQIDEEDLPIILQSPRRWTASQRRGALYVSRSVGSGKSQRTELLHRIILGLVDSTQGDHIRHDTLDNRRSKLRKATVAQNSRNSRSRIGATSQYLGVHKRPYGLWRASCTTNRRNTYIGEFMTEIAAARAYDDAVRHDPFANLNFPEAIAA